MKETQRVTRFEVIDENGRAYVRYGVSVELSLQDNDRTLKIFVQARAGAPSQEDR
jgi:hypothetical protein